MRGLTRLQEKVAKIVLSAAEPYEFALAGGAGLVAAGLSARPTEDLDAFSWAVTDVREAAEAVIAALEIGGFDVERERCGSNFVRMFATDADDLRRRRQVKIELGRDYIAWPPIDTRLGRVLCSRDLSANKVLALFSRIRPRDLCDVAILSTQCDLEQVLLDARTKDLGFSRSILAEMIHMVMAEPDSEWPTTLNSETVRGFGDQLAKALEEGEPVGGVKPAGSLWVEKAGT